MPNIKIDNIEVSEESLRKVIKEHSELFEIKKERPLGGDFDMLEYLRMLDSALDMYKYVCDVNVQMRINALIKIWEWKEKNDGQFGDKEVFDGNIQKFIIYYFCYAKKLDITTTHFIIQNTELPYFSSAEIAIKALKELEAEYKIVFNVA